MHSTNSGSFDIHLNEISKIEGRATLDIKVRDHKVEDLQFSISEWKRFYTQAIRGKPALSVPQLVARICGTCSNAHLLCSIEAIEKAFSLIPSVQTRLLRKLLYYGLIIRDHALHLYIFALPDLLGKESILDFDEKDPVQHQMLHDVFAVKEAGNQLSTVTGGRSVHAPNATVGGFLKLPQLRELKGLKNQLQDIRPKILALMKIFANNPTDYSFDLPLVFSGLKSEDFSFLQGIIKTSQGKTIPEEELGQHLDAIIIPYSHARGFLLDENLLMVGALSRLNVSKEKLHPQTQESAAAYLSQFPSTNLYLNNLAQAIEILHALDASVEIIENLDKITQETPLRVEPKESTGVGVIEAPRGTLYHKYTIDSGGKIKRGEIIVPSGQNQIVMEKTLYLLVERLLTENVNQSTIVTECEGLIRAFDPCMSCAAHFLKVNWL